MAIHYTMPLIAAIWKIYQPHTAELMIVSIKTTFRAGITSLNQKKLNKNDQKEFFGV
jgi:hypothetical protein